MRCCRYTADSTIEDFVVCALHDAPQVRALLEQLKAPAAYRAADGRPIVLPCGELEESDFEPKMGEDKRAVLGWVKVGRSARVLPCFDLTNKEFSL